MARGQGWHSDRHQGARAERPSHPRRSGAGDFAHFGTPAADAAKPLLQKELTEADASDEPQIAWALVELNDQPSLDRVLHVYRAGHLAKVQRIGGGSAFDPEKLAKMAPPDKWMSYAKDESGSVRQLVATILSANAEPKYTDALITLVQDKDIDVAREAAPGLGRIGDEKSRKPLLDALGKADKESRKKFLQALRDGIGGIGLVDGACRGGQVQARDDVASDPRDLRHASGACGSARWRRARPVHRERPSAPLEDRGRHAAGRSRRSSRGSVPRRAYEAQHRGALR